MSKCFLCGGNNDLNTHHIFGGTANRKLSEKYNLKVKLCHEECHQYGKRSAHKCKEFQQKLHEYGQRKFMAEQNATITDFIRIFGRNYIEGDF